MPLLSVQNLQYLHLQPVSFSLREKECLGVYGASGAGKTRLLRALADLDPHSGDIALYGTPLAEFQPNQWRRTVMLLPSEAQWWFDTVGAHFADPDRARFERLGFDSKVLDWPVSRLSSGEKQRLSLLRALQFSPRVLLLDEPSSNLDPRFVGEVETLLREYKDERPAGLIWVSHDAAQLQRVSDRQLRIDDSKIEEVQL